MFGTKRRIIILVLIPLLFVKAFSEDTTPAAQPSPRLLEGLSPEAVMDIANAWGMQADENKVTIWTTSRAIHFEFASGEKSVIALPDDLMVVSVAPYIMKTHPCKEHFPSSCRGELANTPVRVRAVTTDGKVILEEDTKTLPNGFVDLWLPRDLQINLAIEARGLKATQRIGTSDADKTCITEPKLHY